MEFLIQNKKKKNVKKIISEDHFIIEDNSAYAGKHIVIDLWNTTFDNKVSTLKKIIKKAINIANAKMLHIHLHRFGKEQGISGVAVLAESHISVHTWPEREYIAFDIFMCGDTMPEMAAKYLVKFLNPKRKNINIIKRGITAIDEKMYKLAK
ncbi:MAG: adenosylmethionine decarboxylase [Rickettsiales bacterium]|nr:adenosylmethionine decarboxylase [Rickettsiales bacterium]OUV80528.1 MAG: adenosylmethionine decarboxylase [Rickettsiales bacterium TMED131]|tara:strand:+ start:805 stop:1260 length:456 start_codon:yes stop_codon:yes gene_type:complete